MYILCDLCAYAVTYAEPARDSEGEPRPEIDIRLEALGLVAQAGEAGTAMCEVCGDDCDNSYYYDNIKGETMATTTITITVGHNIGTTNKKLPQSVIDYLPTALRNVVNRHSFCYLVETGTLTGGDEPATIAYAYPVSEDATISQYEIGKELYDLSVLLQQDCIGLTTGETEFIGTKPWA